MNRKSLSDSFDGHAGDRLIPFLAWIPLLGFALTPIMIATSMTNPFFSDVRNSASQPAATKWMTLKWRIILISIAFITLAVYNYLYWDWVDIFSYSFFDRFIDTMPLVNGLDNWIFFVFFYVLMPIVTVVLFVLSLIQVLCSRGIIKSTSVFYKLRGKYGIPQLFSLMFFFGGMCGVASGIHDNIFVYEDFIILCNFYFVSSFLWIFRKTNYDFKKDFGDEKVVWKSSASESEDKKEQ